MATLECLVHNAKVKVFKRPCRYCEYSLIPSWLINQFLYSGGGGSLSNCSMIGNVPFLAIIQISYLYYYLSCCHARTG